MEVEEAVRISMTTHQGRGGGGKGERREVGRSRWRERGERGKEEGEEGDREGEM